MPKLNTSDQAKHRAARLLQRLLQFANHELEDLDDSLNNELGIKWSNETGEPKLLVRTQMSALTKLVSPQKCSPKVGDQIRHDLKLFEDFLKILDDHRFQRQGAKTWHFTLRLWSRSTQKNLEEFERVWNQQKRRSTSEIERPDPEVDFEQLPIDQSATQPLHNLPSRTYPAFIDGQANLNRLLTILAADQPALISIEGTGGIGKTTLALEGAHRCLQARQNPATFPGVPTFGAIIFVSAKTQRFVGNQLAPRPRVESHLKDLLRTIFRTLNLLDVMPLTLEQQIEAAQDYLSRQQTLLIVDNLETLEEQTATLAFLEELPVTVKVVLTSRVRLGVGTGIALSYLSLEESLALIQQYAASQNVAISSEQAQMICQQSGGLPLAIAYGIGQIAVWGVLPDRMMALIQEQGEFMHYCFAEAVRQIQGQPAHTLLMTLALFAQPATAAALQAVAAIDQNEATAGLAMLHRLFLTESRQGYYGLHSLTRSYIEQELEMHPDFEREARSRMVVWYINLLQPYGSRNWRDWQAFSSLEQEWENLCAVMTWCKVQERYNDFKQIWQQLKGYTQFNGHWLERLNWLDWLTTMATQRSDTATLADTLYHTSRTLYLFAQPESTQQAIDLCQQAWQLVQAKDDWILQVDLTIHLAALYAQQQQFDQAMNWLNIGENLLRQFSSETQTMAYQWIDIDYYKAEIYLHHGNFQQAKQFCIAALKKAEQVGWHRASVYTRSKLAYVSIAEGQFTEARQLLNFVLVQATVHQDKRLLSFCQNSLALLEKEQGNLLEAEHWAKLAKLGFRQLKMQDKASEMEDLLASISLE